QCPINVSTGPYRRQNSGASRLKFDLEIWHNQKEPRYLTGRYKNLRSIICATRFGDNISSNRQTCKDTPGCYPSGTRPWSRWSTTSGCCTPCGCFHWSDSALLRLSRRTLHRSSQIRERTTYYQFPC